MKLIIQIPCYNEEATLPQTLADLPKSIEGVDVIEVLVINDGSKDGTVEVARQHGVHHIVDLEHNRGLAQAFKAGIEHSIRSGADIIVNTDADNQYCGADIPKLVQPVVQGKSDIVIGARPIMNHPEFPFYKKILQRMGSYVVRKVSLLDVPDATSGFRAYSRDAAMRINIFTHFSYCLETLVQAGNNHVTVSSVPIRVNRKTRDSRLFHNLGDYLYKSSMTIVRLFVIYRASFFFTRLGILPIALSVILTLRYIYFVFVKQHAVQAFWPSLLLAGFLLIIGFQLFLTGIIAQTVSSNRKLTEELLYQHRKSAETAEDDNSFDS